MPVGIIATEGTFHTAECVEILAANRSEQDPSELDTTKEPLLIGRALVNYSSLEIDRIKGLQSSTIEDLLGYADTDYVAYRDNMAFFKGKRAHEILPKNEIVN